jgi:predicted nucleotidyltransferase
MRPLDALLSEPAQRLLAKVLPNPTKDFGTLELLSAMGSSRGAGSTLLRRWVQAGLLKERRVGNQRRLSANPAFVLYPELRSIALKTVGLAQPLAHALAPIAQQLKEAFIFGSVATSSDTSESDIDLAVVGNVDLFSLSPLLDNAEKDVGRHIHVSLYSEVEWASTDDAVIRDIKAGPRIDLTEMING